MTDPTQQPNGNRTVNTVGTCIEGDVNLHGGDYVSGDKVTGNKIVQFFTNYANAERARRAQRNRQAMIQKIRFSWIDGVLRQSLYQVARIELNMQEQIDAVAHLWETIVQEQGRQTRVMGPAESMVTVFDELGLSLLI